MTIRKEEPAWFSVDSMNGRYLFGDHDNVPDGVIRPGQTAQIYQVSHLPFKGERLFVQARCAPSFLLREVFVGAQHSYSQVNQAPLITEPFAVDFEELPRLSLKDADMPIKITIDRPMLELLGAPFALPPLLPGLSLLMNVEHIGERPMRFLAAFLGRAQW
jgi:hypothetical protein